MPNSQNVLINKMKKIRILVGCRSGEASSVQINSSSGRCLFCGNNGASNCRVSNNDYYCGAVALKMLTRYLNIDVSKLLSNSVDGADRKGEWEGHHQNELNLEEMARSFCDGCESNVVKFWEVYQDFEVVRLQLEQSLQKIMEHLKSSKTEDQHHMTDKDGTLKRQVLRKCGVKLASVPRIRMEEIGKCYKNVNVPTSGATKMRMEEEGYEQYEHHEESVPIIKQEESDTGSMDYSDGDGDAYKPNNPAGSPRNAQSSSSSSSESNPTKSIVNNGCKNVPVSTSGRCDSSTSMREANECIKNESVPVAQAEDSDAESTNDADDADDGDYVPASPDSSLSGASSSSESDSEKSKTTVTEPEKATQPVPSTAPVTSYQKLKKLHIANRKRQVKPCCLCGNKFPTPNALHLHMRLHTKAASRKSIKCSYCPQISVDSLEHQQHVLCSHPIEFMGSDLPIGTTKQKLNRVLEQMLNQCDRVLVVDNECFRCSICHSVLTNVFDWRVHVMETHLSYIVTTLLNQQRESETFGIDCEQESSLKGAGDPNPTFKVCLHCGKHSRHRNNHLMHVREVHPFEYYPIPPGININERNFMKCLSKACEQIVKTVVSEKNNWQCPFCPTSYCERASCRMHMCRKHLGAILSGADSSSKRKPPNPNQCRKTDLSKKKRIKCEYCGKTLWNPTQYRSHCVTNHCYEFFSDQVYQLPSHVTETNLEWAIETMMEEGRLTASENRMHYQCRLCKRSKLYRSWTFRDHLFSYKHFEEVCRLLIQKIENSEQVTRHQRAAALGGVDHALPKQSSTSTSATKIVTDVDSEDPITCIHCGTVCRDKHKYKEHLRTNHSYHYYIKQLPNISEKDFNRTLKDMISESKLNHATSTGLAYKCILCKVMKSGTCGMKIHLLSKTHFPQLLSRLNSNTDKSDKAPRDSSGDSHSTSEERSGSETSKTAKPSHANRRSWNPNTNRCRACRKVFLNSKTLLLHMSCHTNTLASQACTYCTQTFSDPLEHQQHVFCSHAELFFAEELPKGTSKAELESVFQRLISICEMVVENNRESVKCSMCNTVVSNSLEWRVHMWETHLPTLIEVLENKVEITKASKGLDSLLRCKYCGKVSNTLYMHRLHLKAIHSFKAYFHKFPPGTNVSEQAFTQSLLNACSLGEKVVVNKKTRVRCPFCPMVHCKRQACKVHMLEQHLPDLISAATETAAMKPNGGRSLRHKFRPSKDRKKKGKEILCMYSPCGKVFGTHTSRHAHSVSNHPFQHLNRLNKLPKGTCEQDLLITIERMVEEARLTSSLNGRHYQCTMCKPARLFTSSSFRSHLLSQSFHLHEVLARLPKIRNSSNSTTDEAIVPICREGEKEDDVLTKLKCEDNTDDDDDEMEVPSSDPLMTADKVIICGDNLHIIANDKDMELDY